MGVVNGGTVGQNEFFFKIRWLVNSILALEPKFHADWSKNGHATRKKNIFCCFWAKIGGLLMRERLVKMIFFYKIRWLVHSILAREPKFHADWFRNGHATRKKPKNGP